MGTLVPSESTKGAGSLRKKALITFFKVLKEFPSPLFKIKLKIPVFIYSFLNSQSAVIYQIRNKLLKRLNITGFKTFRQAKNMLNI
ncbi:hypothetical protein LCGC14_1009060 [marine sediment metagenome]|uniref:Uncharacterized protein n=1 Tax=marine sediment metagenome TaxID=412755 RepID=A0A0F9R6X4_9ZZZZ